MQRKEVTVLPFNDDRYPLQLKTIPDPPICLYVRGKLEVDTFDHEKQFAIVGTRNPTSYGIQVTQLFATRLAEAGLTIVSGLALGVDAAAHRSALDHQGKTIAVLGCGVDLPHPPSNIPIYRRIVDGGGVVVSEFPPGMTVKPGLFVARNRIISGLSNGVLVVEGTSKSGALITARYAAEQGRDVYAVPAPITSTMSEAPNLLIKEGVNVVTSPDDILDSLHIGTRQGRRVITGLSDREEKVYKLLVKESLSADDLSMQVGEQITEVLKVVSLLELKGVIRMNAEGKYVVTS